MSSTARALTAVVGLVLTGCTSADDPAAITETVTATVTAETEDTTRSEEGAQPTPTTSSSELRTLVEEAVAGNDFEVTPDMCTDWWDRRSEVLDLVTNTILEELEPLRPSDPQEVKEVSAEVIADHLDEECSVVGSRGEVTDPTSMAAVAGLNDCYEPWATTDHVGNDFTVTLCGTPDDQAVSLYEYDRAEYPGMVEEYTEITHVTPTWAVAASTYALLDQVVTRLESASWSSSEGAPPEPTPTGTDRGDPPAPESDTEGWDVVDGNYYATVTACPLDEWGDPVATVEVLNDSPQEADVLGIVEVTDNTTGELHSYMFFYAERVRPGQLVSTEAVSFDGAPEDYLCSAMTVGIAD